MRPLAIHYVGPFTAILARLRVLQGELREAERLFEQALASVEALGARPARVRILTDFASLLATVGQRDRADERRAEASELARSLGVRT